MKTKFCNIKLKHIFDNIKEADNIVITGHTNVDTDCASSILALYFFCKKYNKNVKAISADIKPKAVCNVPHIEKIDFLDNEEIFDKSILESATLIVVDAGEMRRIGYINEYTNLCKQVYFIDHHKNKLDSKKYTLKNVNKYYIDEASAATAQIIAKMFLSRNEISKDIATLLYAGITSDTGGFIFSNTSSETLLIASQLIKCDANLESVVSIIKRRYNENDMKAYKQILSSIVICDDKRVAYIYSEDKIAGIAIKELSISLVEMTMQIDGVEIGFIIRNESGHYRVSLRSRCDKDILPIAIKFGGGGHLKAAGFEIDSSKYTKEYLIEAIYSEIKSLYN